MSDENALDRAEAFLNDDAAAAESARLTQVTAMGERIADVLRNVYDPEIPVNIYDMGLIYKIDVEDDDSVHIEMTLTSPHCPVAETLPVEVGNRVKEVEGVTDATVAITWDPPWNHSMMSEEAQLELGMMY